MTDFVVGLGGPWRIVAFMAVAAWGLIAGVTGTAVLLGHFIAAVTHESTVLLNESHSFIGIRWRSPADLVVINRLWMLQTRIPDSVSIAKVRELAAGGRGDEFVGMALAKWVESAYRDASNNGIRNEFLDKLIPLIDRT